MVVPSTEWLQFARRVWRRMDEHEVFGRSAQLSYYFLLAVFPALLFLTVVLGLLADTGTQLREALFSRLNQVMPPSALDLVDHTLREISLGAGGGKLSLGLLGTIWAASKGTDAIQIALNVAYGVKERRPWWRMRLVSLLLTLAMPVLLVGAMGLILFGSWLGETAAGYLGLSAAFTFLWNLAQFPLGVFFIVVAFNLIDHFAPSRKRRWRWYTPGAAVGAGLWLAASALLRVYLSYFDSYSATYGSLGAVIILMLWLYLSGTALLIVGEVNSELDSQSSR